MTRWPGSGDSAGTWPLQLPAATPARWTRPTPSESDSPPFPGSIRSHQRVSSGAQRAGSPLSGSVKTFLERHSSPRLYIPQNLSAHRVARWRALGTAGQADADSGGASRSPPNSDRPGVPGAPIWSRLTLGLGGQAARPLARRSTGRRGGGSPPPPSPPPPSPPPPPPCAPLEAAPAPAAAPRPHLGRPCALGGSAAPAPPPPPSPPARRVVPGPTRDLGNPSSPPPPPPGVCSAAGLDAPGPAVAPPWCGGGGDGGSGSCSPGPARPAAPSAGPAGSGSGAPAGAEAGAALPGSRAPTPPPPPPPPPPAAPGPKAARLRRMVRLAAELLLLLGLLLLTLHITVLRGSGATDGRDATAANASRTQLQNNLNVESASTSETSSPLSKEAPGKHLDHQAAHQPFPRQKFQQEAGHPSLQRDGPRSFLLDLPNFPDLSKADINGQNPNIQVNLGN
ncbi:basic proline-rich protein-like [Phacochoerus africanus]|uniref:basic proline-rich protein-like n=1 Tax=Phacochoerus africanus TaxID=41426 RepID=UPI001FD948CA|nr:basic proline-rich protein-like [Phacochoerus africanus]